VTGPLVSIVTTFLDAEDFLAEAIDSVRGQSHPHWELLLIDDGSRDGSTGIARRAAAQSGERIRYFEHDGHRNLGLFASRNLGMRQARGQFVTSLDSDDLFFPDNLSRQLAAFARFPRIDAAFCATLFWQWDAAFADRADEVQDFGALADRLVPAPEMLLALTAQERLHPANCATMVRRAALERIGGYEKNFPGMYEDTVLLTKLLLGSACHVSGECLCAYRAHAKSQCHVALAENRYTPTGLSPSREAYLLWAADYAEAQSGGARLRKTVLRELAPYRRHGVLPWLAHGLRRRIVKAAARFKSPAGESSPRLREAGALREIAAFYRRTGRPADAARAEQRAAAADKGP
jgi:hypothetical protein